MSVLRLAVKAEYFNAIKAGTKTEEYRLCTVYWHVRIVRRQYDTVEITLGYPKRGDTSRRLIFPWNGFETKTITHPHFGTEPVKVYAIKLQPKAAA